MAFIDTTYGGYFVFMRSNIVDITGQRFGRLVAIKIIGRDKQGNVLWECQCDCGNKNNVRLHPLKGGMARSCGCISLEVKTKRLTTHGMSNSPEFKSWSGMIQRCHSETCKDFKNYGGRGIKVCDRWVEGFSNFFEDMGRKPSAKHSIDRKDVNLGYYKGNCRWATNIVQSNNKRNTEYINFYGEKYALADFCRKFNIKRCTVWRSRKLKGEAEMIAHFTRLGWLPSSA